MGTGPSLRRVQAQNSPQIMRLVEDNWPQGPDGDDIAQNGMILKIKEREAPAEADTGRRRR